MKEGDRRDIVRGDRMAQDTSAIWRHVHDGLRAFIAKRVADESEAEDILQEVFLRIHRGLEDLKDPGRVMPWIYRIARHAIIDHYRAPARRREVSAGLTADLEATIPPDRFSDSSASADEPQAELAGCLRPMIGRLSKEYREAVTLVELEGLTRQTAAKQMGLSLSGMKSRVQRGRRQLKQMLDECCLIELDRRRGVTDYAVRDAKGSPCTSPDGGGD
jgi:RNA polymerase sigma-70 factor (ECF subfamily)